MAALIQCGTDHLFDFDGDIYALSAQLQEVYSGGDRKEKYPEDKPSDYVLASRDFEAELERCILLLQDQRFAQSIAEAVETDAVALEQITAQEEQACRDRDFALRYSGNETDADTGPWELDVPAYMCNEEGGPSTERQLPSSDTMSTEFAGSSALCIPAQQGDLEEQYTHKVVCVICTDKFRPRDIVRLSCPDIYCKGCLASYFMRTSANESIFPPRCCGKKIPITLIEAELSSEDLIDFQNAELEFTTTNRIYCAHTTCGRFIPPDQVGPDVANCTECNNETCIHCRHLGHDGYCPADEALQAVVKLGLDSGWQRCFGCHAMVELNTGCHHIT